MVLEGTSDSGALMIWPITEASESRIYWVGFQRRTYKPWNKSVTKSNDEACISSCSKKRCLKKIYFALQHLNHTCDFTINDNELSKEESSDKVKWRATIDWFIIWALSSLSATEIRKNRKTTAFSSISCIFFSITGVMQKHPNYMYMIDIFKS